MDAHEFETALKADGFTEIQTSSYDARPANGFFLRSGPREDHLRKNRIALWVSGCGVNPPKQPLSRMRRAPAAVVPTSGMSAPSPSRGAR